MSKLIIDGKNSTENLKELSFKCGICDSENTSIYFFEGFSDCCGSSSGGLIFSCDSCKAEYNILHDKDWKK